MNIERSSFLAVKPYGLEARNAILNVTPRRRSCLKAR